MSSSSQTYGASKNFSLIVMFFPEIYFKRDFWNCKQQWRLYFTNEIYTSSPRLLIFQIYSTFHTLFLYLIISYKHESVPHETQSQTLIFIMAVSWRRRANEAMDVGRVFLPCVNIPRFWFAAGIITWYEHLTKWTVLSAIFNGFESP